MAIISFVLEAGESVFDIQAGGLDVSPLAAAPELNGVESVQKRIVEALKAQIVRHGLEMPEVRFDNASQVVSLHGAVSDQAMAEKIVMCCGNVRGVSAVDNRLVPDLPSAESQWHVVVAGDTLSKIAREKYGSANAYSTIFEGNFPMLNHPDQIYPGQVLRIPSL